MSAYYNEIDPYAAQWLRNLIAAGLIAPGDVDERSITDVRADDVAGYTQCHFFAGIAGWSLAARLALWPDDRELWTGSAPCQPFSAAGEGKGFADERDLWPHYFRLICARRPAIAMGEQVAAAVGKHWLDRVFADLESIDYACRAPVLPACSVDAPHGRDRLWIVAHPAGSSARECGDAGCEEGARRTHGDNHDGCSDVALADSMCAEWRTFSKERNEQYGHDPGRQETTSGLPTYSAWDGTSIVVGNDGKARRVKPGVHLLAHGIPNRMGRLRAYGNAIVPQVAAQVIAAYMETRP